MVTAPGLDAPERWEAQDAIIREARHASKMGLHGKALRLVRIAGELGPLSPAHARDGELIEIAHQRARGNNRKAA